MPVFPFPGSASGAGAASGFEQTAGQGIDQSFCAENGQEMTLLHICDYADRRAGRSVPRQPLAGICRFVRSHDPEDLPGLASITSSMMREGTASRSSLQLSEALETMAATLVVGTGMSATDAQCPAPT